MNFLYNFFFSFHPFRFCIVSLPQIHKSVDALKCRIDPAILPKEYGGTVPMADMIKEFKQELLVKRAAILALDDMQIEVSKDAANFAGNDVGDLESGVVGSFRKLEVD